MKVLILGAGAVGGYFGGRLVEWRQKQLEQATTTLKQQQQQQQQEEPQKSSNTTSHSSSILQIDHDDDDHDDDHLQVVDVTFLVRPGRATQLERDGLILDDVHVVGMKRTIRNVSTLISGGSNNNNNNEHNSDAASPVDVPVFDAIVLTCKSFGLDGALDAVAPYVHSDVAILPLLNGMAHMETIAARFPEATVWGGTCGIVASLDAETGVICKRTDSAWVKVGTQMNDGDYKSVSRIETLVRSWKEAGIEAERIKDGAIEQAMWNKWIFLASLGASNCLLQGTVGEIMNTDYGERVIDAMIQECKDVADAELAESTRNDGSAAIEETRQLVMKNVLQRNSPLKTSMARDMNQGFPTEANHLIGDLIARAQRRGISTPLLLASYTRLQIYERQRDE